MISSWSQHISTYLKYSIKYSIKYSTTKSSECTVCQSVTLSWGRASQSQKVQLREICSEKCQISFIGSRSGIFTAHIFQKCSKKCNKTFRCFPIGQQASTHRGHVPQKTVVSWQVDTQNASSRSLVSTGKAGPSQCPWNAMDIWISHNISGYLKITALTFYLCYHLLRYVWKFQNVRHMFHIFLHD